MSGSRGKARVETGRGAVAYRITHRDRVTKRMHLELDPDGGLRVVAPRHWSEAQVGELLQQHAQHVERFLDRARRRRLPPLRYAAGGIHWFRGRQYRLRLEEASGGRSGLTLDGDQLIVRGPAKDEQSVALALRRWYLSEARRRFHERLDAIARRAPWVGDRAVALRLRRMKRTWGTCSREGVVRLNTHLVKAPPACLDYVIAHELCHLREMNHGPAFYRLQQRLFPDWRTLRAHLREHGHRYTQE